MSNLFGSLSEGTSWNSHAQKIKTFFACIDGVSGRRQACHWLGASEDASASALQFLSHFNRLRLSDLCLGISNSSFNRCTPPWIVDLRNEPSITFVSSSASWAPEWTHLKVTFSSNKSSMDLAWSCVLNSAQSGGAVLVTRSYNDLQSVPAMASGRDVLGIICSFPVGDAIAAGRSCKDSWGFFQFTLLSLNQARKRRI